MLRDVRRFRAREKSVRRLSKRSTSEKEEDYSGRERDSSQWQPQINGHAQVFLLGGPAFNELTADMIAETGRGGDLNRAAGRDFRRVGP